MCPFDPWDHLGRRVTPMLAVHATTTVVVTVAAGTRCAWYGLTGPLILYLRLPTTTAPYLSYYWVMKDILTSISA